MDEDMKACQLVHKSWSLKAPALICRREFRRGTFHSYPPGTLSSLFILICQGMVIPELPGTACTPVSSRIVLRLDPVFDLISVETALSRNLMKGLVVFRIELVNFKNLFSSITCRLLPVIFSMTQQYVDQGRS